MQRILFSLGYECLNTYFNFGDIFIPYFMPTSKRYSFTVLHILYNFYDAFFPHYISKKLDMVKNPTVTTTGVVKITLGFLNL